MFKVIKYDIVSSGIVIYGTVKFDILTALYIYLFCNLNYILNLILH